MSMSSQLRRLLGGQPWGLAGGTWLAAKPRGLAIAARPLADEMGGLCCADGHAAGDHDPLTVHNLRPDLAVHLPAWVIRVWVLIFEQDGLHGRHR